MGQPHRTGRNRWEPLSELCPECGSVNSLVMTMKSPETVSCRCTVCAHVWPGVTSVFPGPPPVAPGQEPPHECSTCGSHNVGLGTVTPYSVYFRCHHCGEIWAFPDRRHVPRISGDVPVGRKKDKRPD